MMIKYYLTCFISIDVLGADFELVQLFWCERQQQHVKVDF